MPVQTTVLRVVVAGTPAARQAVSQVIEAVNRESLESRGLQLLTVPWDGGDLPAGIDLAITEAAIVAPAVLRYQNEEQLHTDLNRYVSDTSVRLAMEAGIRPPLVIIKQVIDSIGDGSAGWAFKVANERKKHYWVKGTLQTVLELYLPRAKDAYVVWLKPVVDTQRLTVYEYENLPLSHDHYEFKLGEGLAGRVWQTGQAAVHSLSHPHPWWAARRPGQTITYICVPLGRAASPDGLLSVGSDAGFDLQPGDSDVLGTFASLLKLGACL